MPSLGSPIMRLFALIATLICWAQLASAQDRPIEPALIHRSLGTRRFRRLNRQRQTMITCCW